MMNVFTPGVINPAARLEDGFGRHISYLRISVTDRCDFRCVYCMDDDMQFLPRADILSLEEIVEVARAFVALGGRKIRLTGGEPLVRHGIVGLAESLAAIPDLRELVLTTNGSQLTRYAADLKRAGVKRLNISLDSLKPERFTELTRVGDLAQVLAGIDAARDAGFEHTKLNAVIMRGRNDDEVIDLVRYALAHDLDISFIEEMPLGVITEHSRQEAFVSSAELREIIETEYALSAVAENTGGPSRYFRANDFASRIGFISPHSHNFCDDCNRVRLTAEGRLLLCLGNEHSVDFRQVLRSRPGDQAALLAAFRHGMAIKPDRHYFDHAAEPQILRFMNMTGG